MFHAINGLMDSCRRNTRSYSSHPEPPCLSASRITSLEYASMSRVVGSEVRIATYALNQNNHETNDGTSLSLVLLTVLWGSNKEPAPMEDSWFSRAMLSANTSRISMNCPDCIRCTSEYGMGSAAGDRIIPGRDSGGADGRGMVKADGRAVSTAGCCCTNTDETGSRIREADNVAGAVITEETLDTVGKTPADTGSDNQGSWCGQTPKRARITYI